MALIEGRGGVADFHDPHVPAVPPTREHAAFTGRPSQTLDPLAVGGYDAVLIATDHDAVDYQALVDAARLVVDTRNVCARKGVRGGVVVKA